MLGLLSQLDIADPISIPFFYVSEYTDRGVVLYVGVEVKYE